MSSGEGKKINSDKKLVYIVLVDELVHIFMLRPFISWRPFEATVDGKRKCFRFFLENSLQPTIEIMFSTNSNEKNTVTLPLTGSCFGIRWAFGVFNCTIHSVNWLPKIGRKVIKKYEIFFKHFFALPLKQTIRFVFSRSLSIFLCRLQSQLQRTTNW